MRRLFEMGDLQNILLVVVDALRRDMCIGPNRSILTPNIDRLVSEGLSIDPVIAVNSLTLPCVASILSGLYPIHHGIRGQRPSDSSIQLEQSIVSELNRLGYNTYAEVSGPFTPDTGVLHGFDVINARDGSWGDHFFGNYGEDLLARLRSGGFAEPWFIFLHIWSLHVPVEPSAITETNRPLTDYERAVVALDKRLGELMEVVGPDTLITFTSDHGERTFKPGISQASAKMRMNMWRRARSVPLLRKGLVAARNALLGKGLLEFGHGYHVFDYLVLVPLSFYFPLKIGPQRIEMQASQVDIAPTLMGLLGLEWREKRDFAGRSLLGASRRPAFIEATTNRSGDPSEWLFAVRWPPHKLVITPGHPSVRAELYRLDVPSPERRDYSKDEGDVVEKLHCLARDFLRTSELHVRSELDTEEEDEIRSRLEALGYL